MEDKVLFEEQQGADGKRIGIISLNNPRQLHALNASMFPLMHEKLLAWQADEGIACVFLTSGGERAFCAGGDVKSLQQILVQTEGDEAKQTVVSDYFSKEYQVDHLLHSFTKPIIVWGDGIIMGGGLGLFMGCSHRVVTETARIAMPEITIGLFPDVGATWFLNRLPHAGIGLFLGLTGASINGLDAEYLGMSSTPIRTSQQDALIQHLLTIAWSDNVSQRHAQVDDALMMLTDRRDFAQANLPHHQDFFTQLQQQDSLDAVMGLISQHDSDDEWFKAGRSKLLQGSPISAHILYRQITEYQHLPLASCFRLEADLAVNVCLQGDLVEGVRALLVDKDNQPEWLFNNVASVPDVLIDDIFKSPWAAAEHPLVHLQ